MILDLNESELVALRGIIARELARGATSLTSLNTKVKTAQNQAGVNSPTTTTWPDVLKIIKVTDALTGGGYYEGIAYNPDVTLCNSSTNLTTAKLEGYATGSCRAFDLQEVGAGTNDLTAAGNTTQIYFVGIQIGRSGDYPLFALLGNAIWLDSCPSSLLALSSAESYAPVTTDTTLTFEDTVVLVDATAGDVTITLPGAADTNVPGTSFTVKKIDASANLVIVASADTIDGAADYELELQYEFVEITSGGAAFYVTGE